MPTINLVNASFKLGKKIESVSSGTSNFDLLALSKSIQEFGFSPFSVVPAVGSLPSASGRAGQIYYVEADTTFYFSNGSSWNLLTEGQKLWTWGNNENGQLGNHLQVNRSSPGTTAGGGNSWCYASIGYEHALAIEKSGALYLWGDNRYGQLGDNSVLTRTCPVRTIDGCNTWRQAQASTCCGFTSIGVKSDGTLWVWGFNASGQLGDNSSISKSSPITVAGGGTTWCYASTGTCHSAGIKSDGTLWTWGNNTCGKLGTNNLTTRSSPGTTSGGLTSWCKVCAGKDNTAGVRTDGTLYTWGGNLCGKLGTNSTTNRSSPGTVSGGGTTWCNVSLGDDHTVAIKTDGTIWTWGRNTAGQLGIGTTISRSSPGTVAGGGTTWINVAAGFGETGAVKSDGTLWTWGCNGSGQLGSSDTINRSSPVTVVNSITWLSVSMGCQSTAAIQSF
jgi:alpha-tubulin suppressor-like RCC1 family protein